MNTATENINPVPLEETTVEVLPELVFPPLFKIGELRLPQPGAHEELLYHRFLCRKSGLLLVGESGVGKSSLSLQMAILWALGKPAFGIVPNGSLSSLIIQSENDDGDLATAWHGVTGGLQLGALEIAQAADNIVSARLKRARGASLAAALRHYCSENRRDLVWIDPTLAYLDGDAASQKDVGHFLRDQIDPIAEEFDCGIILVHHTPKPVAQPVKRSLQNIAYAAFGSAEWTNWARGILVLQKQKEGLFKLSGGKRTGHLRWTDPESGELLFDKMIRYSKEPGVICWEETAEECSSGGKITIETYRNSVYDWLQKGPLPKAKILNDLNGLGLGKNNARDLLNESEAMGLIVQFKEGRHPFLKLAKEKWEASHFTR